MVSPVIAVVLKRQANEVRDGGAKASRPYPRAINPKASSERIVLNAKSPDFVPHDAAQGGQRAAKLLEFRGLKRPALSQRIFWEGARWEVLVFGVGVGWIMHVWGARRFCRTQVGCLMRKISQSW